MATKKKTKKDYPIVKYRIVNGNGYTLCEGEEEFKQKLKSGINFYNELKERNAYDCERFKIQYIVKVTEEYIDFNAVQTLVNDVKSIIDKE